MENKKVTEHTGFDKFIISICLIAAIVLAFTSLLLPPPGIINSSVLVLIGQVLVFVGGIFGLKSINLQIIKKMLDNEKDNTEKNI